VILLNVFDRLARSLFIYIIKFYRFALSPVLGSRCRFSPTCSNYALAAMMSKSTLVALKLIVVRLSKCHPLHSGGYDPVK